MPLGDLVVASGFKCRPRRGEGGGTGGSLEEARAPAHGAGERGDAGATQPSTQLGDMMDEGLDALGRIGAG